jgi:hypothetical protein
MSRNPKMTFESTAFSRNAQRDGGVDRAEPVQENAAIRITTASPGSSRRQVDAEDEAARGEREGRDERGVATSPAARPTKSGNRWPG